jgi:predicted exporter
VKSKRLITLLAALALFVGMGAFVAHELRISTGVAPLLSDATEQELATISAGLIDSPLTRTMALSLSAPDLATAITAMERWAGQLERHPEVESIRLGPGESFGSAAFALYFPRRLLFASSRPERELPDRLSDEGLARVAARLRLELSLPQAPLVEEIASRDPLLTFPDLLRRFQRDRAGGLDVVDGHFADPERSAAIALLTTRHSAFESESQAPFHDFLEQSFEALTQEIGVELLLERSGVHRFAVASERIARAELQRISAISVIGIALLFLIVFRSPRLLLVSLLPLAGGVLAAATLAILAFGEIHVMTLVFGATLIGVCIDYPIHLITHHTLVSSAEGGQGWPPALWGALVMGALTTVAGFVGLTWSSFPGIREIGVFAASGVLAALIATRLLLPPLLPAPGPVAPAQARLARWLGRLLAVLQRRRSIAALALVLAAVLTALGLPRVEWQDDVFALSLAPDESWLEEDRRIRSRVSQMDPGRFVVAVGEDLESALQRNDLVYQRLEQAREQAALDGFRSLHTFLFSAALQRRNSAVFAQSPAFPDRTLRALEAEGFRSAAFEPFVADLRSADPEPLTFEDLVGSPLAEIAAAFRVDLDGRVAILSYLRGVADPETFVTRFADLEDVHYFDQQDFLRELYGRYRTRTTTLILAGLLAVVSILTLRYRRPRLAIAVASPALIAATTTLALLAFAGVAINLLHLLGLLLVLSIGVDYSIFLVASERQTPDRIAAMLSLCIACLSTCLAFGLLSFSSFPALRALGLTTGIGVLLSLLLAPAAVLLAEPRDSAQ